MTYKNLAYAVTAVCITIVEYDNNTLIEQKWQ